MADCDVQPRSSAALPMDRVEWHLSAWERWMHHCTMPGKYSNHASGGLRGYGTWAIDNDARDEELERNSGEAVNAVLLGMPQRLQLAVRINHEITAAVFWLRGPIEDAYAEACAILAVQLARRGLC